MELFEYIKSQLPQMPNSAIMKQLGASQELIDYIKETPENTNFAIAEVIEGSGGGDEPEVWLVGDEYEDEDSMRFFTLTNAGDVDYITELLTNGAKYTVYLNGEELPYFDSSDNAVGWSDKDTISSALKYIAISQAESVAAYTDASTAPTSVEVSVKAK